MNTRSPLEIFYDSGCRVCHAEVQAYLKADRSERLVPIDILAPGFDATGFGLRMEEVRKRFHVRTQEGRILTGVDAFIAIWERLPGAHYALLARLAKGRTLHAVLSLAYQAFAEFRPYLPRRKNACEDGACALELPRRRSGWAKVGALAALLMAASAFASSQDKLQDDLRTVPHVSLERYLGKWYEIASFPQRFQRGCTHTTATYSLRPDGDIAVLNECRIDGWNGEQKAARGKAWITDPESNAKLRVQFFWPFSGKYWIIDLGGDYEYAVVGHPDRDYLWILSRTPQMNRRDYQAILERVAAQGFDLSKLQETDQSGWQKPRSVTKEATETLRAAQ